MRVMLQKYRADTQKPQKDGAVCWYANWMGGQSLVKVDSCRLDKLQGEMRRTVYPQGEADTYFSQPAKCKLAGKIITGYLSRDDDGNLVFRHCYY